MKPKQQRLLLALVALAALVGAAFLALSALRDQAAYFYTPSDVAGGKAVAGKAMRLGGMVRRGSLQRSPDGTTVRFIVEDRAGAVPVMFRGVTPDLFVEGSGVVAEGELSTDGVFAADNLLAKHDENYVPREMKDMNRQDEAKAAQSVIK